MSPDAEATSTCIVLIAGLADNKLFLGRRYAEWCTAAPTLESAVAAAAMAQDEIGHARSFYPLLKEIAGDTVENEPETRTQFSNVSFLDRPFQSWTDFVAANLLFDTCLTVLLESATQSTMNPLAQRARRIVEEEPLHWLHAQGWTRRLAGKGDAVRTALLDSLRVVWPQAHGWLEVAAADLVADGILSHDAQQLRQIFTQRIAGVLASADLPSVC